MTVVEHHRGENVCELHGADYTHRPGHADIDGHHVWPLGMGGPDVPANLVKACQTGHANVHRLLALYLKGGGEVPYAVRRTFAFAEQRYARMGYQAVMGDPEVRRALGG